MLKVLCPENGLFCFVLVVFVQGCSSLIGNFLHLLHFLGNPQTFIWTFFLIAFLVSMCNSVVVVILNNLCSLNN